MTLPPDLVTAVADEFNKVSVSALTKASAELTSRYRSPQRDAIGAFMTSDAHRLAYLAVRLPATAMAASRVMTELRMRYPSFFPRSMADLGAGPGTASWMGASLFPMIDTFTLLERDSSWLSLGRRLAMRAAHPGLQKGRWVAADLTGAIEPHDMTVLSYVIGEIPSDHVEGLVDRIWGATQGVMVVIEPGTPHGFERIRLVRQHLIDKGAYCVAPCPHAGRCPMAGGDWCHFAVRIPRTALHMKIKEGQLSYEDEKFSYFIASRMPVDLTPNRILRHPQHHGGHIDFVVCTPDQVEKRTISKKMGAFYKQARKLEWGDCLVP